MAEEQLELTQETGAEGKPPCSGTFETDTEKKVGRAGEKKQEESGKRQLQQRTGCPNPPHEQRSLLDALGVPTFLKNLRQWCSVENLIFLLVLRVPWVWAVDEEDRSWVDLLKTVPLLRTAIQFLQDTGGWIEAMWHLRFSYSYVPGAWEFLREHGPSEKAWAKLSHVCLGWLRSLR